jgi:predicted Zn finger-like uncharacterized protein
MVITVTCPSCASSFPVDPAKIPEGGVNARCSSCAVVFRIEKPEEAAPAPVVEFVEPEIEAPEPPVEAPEPVVEAPEPAVEEAPEPAYEAPEPAFEAPEPAFEADAPAFEAPEPAYEAPDPVEEIASTMEAPPAVVDSPDDWVVENEEVPAMEAEPMPYVAPVEPPAPKTDPFAVPAPFEAPEPEAPAVEVPVVEEAEPAATGPVKGFTFGKRDPTDKAKRLARVLVSDMIMYNAERHQSALETGTLVQDFEEEIDKSWKEFVDQVGDELASGPGQQFWIEALNDILAKGKRVF